MINECDPSAMLRISVFIICFESSALLSEGSDTSFRRVVFSLRSVVFSEFYPPADGRASRCLAGLLVLS